MGKKKYTTEFKIQALELVKQLGSFSEASRQLGVSDSLLHTWRQRFNFSLESKGKSAAQAIADTEEVLALKKRIQELEKTNYILKKAAAFFSQDHLK
jgi:transposase